MKVIVTGGCGLVGFHAAMFYHDRGHEVTVIDNLERSDLLGHKVNEARRLYNYSKLNKMNIPVYFDDVSVPSTWGKHREADAVIHMAGQCGVPTSINNPRRDFEVNTIGTFNALEFCRRTGAKLVLASTNKVYPLHEGFTKSGGRWNFTNRVWQVNGFPIVNDLVGARTPYGNSKMAADLLCQEWAHTYGVRTGVFRMSCIYGPNQMGFEEQGWATWFIIATLKGWPITIYGDGDQVRDMLYVEDCVKAYDNFIDSGINHGVWNLGGGPGNTLSLNEHLNTLESLTGLRSPVTYSEWRPLDQKCYVSDIRNIEDDLEWKPSINPEKGLAMTLDWVKSNLDLF